MSETREETPPGGSRPAGVGTRSGTGEVMLSMRNISKRFGVGEQVNHVLEAVSLDVRAGELVCLLGPSGCGKSTLLRIAISLEAADEGETLVGGSQRFQPGRDVCMVFQGYGLFPWLRLRDNVAWGLKMQGVRKRERLRVAHDQLALVGLSEYAAHFPHQVSGGMQQRVGLARAFANGAALLLMDEPFAAIDAQTRENLQGELLRMREANNSTIVFVTHSIDEAVFLSDRIVIMDRNPGRIKAVLDVDLPGPRSDASRMTARFSELCVEVRAIFSGDGAEAAGATGGRAA